MLRFVALAAAVLVVAFPAAAGPSFDCTKAQSVAEKTICDVPYLHWTDRQMTRLYKLALSQNARVPEAIVTSQRAFLAHRDTCRDDVACLDLAYKTQFKELAMNVNVNEAFGEYQPDGMGGSMQIVRFGYDAAVAILTVGAADHTCTFDTDSAQLGGKGVIRYADKGANACRMTIAPDSDDVMVVETKNCSDYCGMRARLDGRYKHMK